MRRLARGAAVALVAAAGAPAVAAVDVPALDRITPLSGEVLLRGELRSSFDGSTFDAVTQRDQFPHLEGATAPRTGGLFDPAAGGLRVVEQDPDTHVYRLAPTGARGPACEAAGLASPCLVPRLAELAHERLETAEDLGVTLVGRLEAEAMGPPVVSAAAAGTLGWLAACAGLLGAVALARQVRRSHRATAMGQVRAAAAEARRALQGDATLARAREQIEPLLARAGELDRARRACASRLARLEPARLENRRAAWAGSTAPDAAVALAALDAEAAEADQVALDLASAVAGLERIASSLRALVLRARAERGTRAVASGPDPVEAMRGELALREDAASEAESALKHEGPARRPGGVDA
jgi:hypothetical protein